MYTVQVLLKLYDFYRGELSYAMSAIPMRMTMCLRLIACCDGSHSGVAKANLLYVVNSCARICLLARWPSSVAVRIVGGLLVGCLVARMMTTCNLKLQIWYLLP